jgi:acetate kinase
MDTESVIAKGICERIGLNGSCLTHKKEGLAKEILADMPTHTEAIKLVLDTLVDKDLGVLNDMNEIDNNRSKEFNISRSIDINDNSSSSSIIYRRKEKEIIL